MADSRILVMGRVQGVGFRRFAQKVALRIGLRGAVRNLEDGRVELFVLAPSPEKLKALLEQLKKGPSHGHVSHLEEEILSPEKCALVQLLIDPGVEFDILETSQEPI